MVKRVLRKKRNLPTWLTAMSREVRACNARKKLYQLENLEPRLLLSATELTLAAGITELKLDVDGDDVRVLDQSDNVLGTYDNSGSDFTGFNITGSASSDTIEVKKKDAGDALGSWTLSFNGGAGADTVSFDSVANFGGVSFDVTAESISLGASADITTTGDFDLTAEADSADFSSGSPVSSVSVDVGASLSAADIELSAASRLGDADGSSKLAVNLSANDTTTVGPSATVSVLGSVTASGDLTVGSTATTDLDLNLSNYDLNLTFSPTAKAVVGSQADIDAATFTLGTTINGELDVDGSDGAQFDQVGSSSAVTRVDLGLRLTSPVRRMLR